MKGTRPLDNDEIRMESLNSDPSKLEVSAPL